MSFTMYVHNNKLKIITIRFSDIWNQKVELKFCCDYLNVGTEQLLPDKVSLKMHLDPSNKTILSFFTLNNKPILNQ